MTKTHNKTRARKTKVSTRPSCACQNWPKARWTKARLKWRSSMTSRRNLCCTRRTANGAASGIRHSEKPAAAAKQEANAGDYSQDYTPCDISRLHTMWHFKTIHHLTFQDYTPCDISRLHTMWHFKTIHHVTFQDYTPFDISRLYTMWHFKTIHLVNKHEIVFHYLYIAPAPRR